MVQQSFNFGPSHNVRDPNTSTASNSGIDDVVSKLSALLMGSNSNQQQLENTLKKAVRDGIVEARKDDVRTDDSEERAEARRHRELMQQLSRISGLGPSSSTGGGGKDKEKKEDGITLTDILKWGGIATGILGLVSNFDSLVKIFDDTTKKVGDFKVKVVGMADDVEKLIPKLASAATSVDDVSNEILGMIGNVKDFGKTMEGLVNKAFTPEGAVGALLGAFVPGGVIAKAIFALLGGTAAGNAFNQGHNTTTRGPQSQANMLMNQTAGMGNSQADMLAAQTAGMDIGLTQTSNNGTVIPSIRNAGVNPTAAAAGLGGFAIGGGGPIARTVRGGVAYILGDAIAPGLDADGNPKPSLLSRSKDDMLSIYEANKLYNDDGTRKKETWEGLGAAATVGAATLRSAPKNKWTLGAAAVGSLLAYDWANDDVSILEGLQKRGVKTPSLPDISVALGITPPENPYTKKLNEFDEQIDKLRKELNSAGDPKLSRTENEAIFSKIGKELQRLKIAKKQFISTVDENNTGFIREKLQAIPLDPTSGERPILSTGDLPYIGIGIAWGATAGAASGAVATAPVGGLGAIPGFVTGGAIAAVTSTALTGGFNAAMNEFETYIAEKYGRKIDAIQLATQDPHTLWNILVQYSSENPVTSKLIFGGIAAGIMGTKGASKILITLAKKRLGMSIAGTATTSTMVTQAGIKTAGAFGFGAGVANSFGNQKDILGNDANITSILSSPNTNIISNTPSLGTTDPRNYYTLNIDPLAPTPREKVAMGNYGGTNIDPLAPTPREKVAMGNYGGSAPNTPSALPSNDVIGTGSLTHDKLKGDNNTFANNKFVNDGLTTIIKTKRGTEVEVATSRAQQFLGFLNDLEDANYNIKTIKGLSNRHGSKDLPNSTHNMGIAIDINASTNQQASREGGPRMTDMNPELVRNLARRYDLEWGGDYGRPDAMHFTVAKSKRTRDENQDIIANSIFAKRAMGIKGSGDLGAMGDLVGQILGTESEGDPNAFYGSNKHRDLLGGKELSSMTFDELKTFQKEITKRQGTSPVGIGQWIGSTLHGSGYDDTGFLRDYFGRSDYGNEVFSLDRQKDMFRKFLKSPKYGNLEGFMAGKAGTPEEFAKHLGGQWQGVQPEEQQKRLVETLKKLQKEPGLNIDQALDKVMGQMESLNGVTGKFGSAIDTLSKNLGEGFDKLSNFLKNITEQASGLLPQELKDLIDIPAIGEFFSPLFGGESRSTLAHPKKTFTSQEQLEIKSLLMGNVALDGNAIAQQSSKLEKDKLNAQASGIGNVINMAAGGGETIHGQPIAGLHGNVNTHFPGDIDAISATIYKWTDAPMFYAAGKIG